MKISLPLTVLVVIMADGSGFAQSWPNEPAGAQMLVDCPFSGNTCNIIDNYNSAAFVNDPSAPSSGPSVLDNYLAANATTGNAEEWYPLHKERELFIGTWWKTNPEFQGYGNGANKLMVFTGDEGQGYLMWGGAPDQPRPIGAAICTNIWNNCHVPNVGADCANSPWVNPNVGNGNISAGSGWHRLELYQKSSSTASSRDGVMRWWVDGKLVGNYTNLNYMSSGFVQFTITHTWDGQAAATCEYRDCSRSWHHYFDHIRISVPNGNVIDPVMPLTVSSSSLPSAQSGKAYTATLQAQNGKAPYGWTISAGSLPPGLTLNKTTGVISGIPTIAGISNFTAKVMDASVPAAEATKVFSITVSRSTGIAEGRLTVNGLQLTAKPGSGSVRFQMPQLGTYSLGVHDLSGREVWRHSGIGEAVWNHGGNLKKGVYLVRAEQNGRSMTTNYCHLW